MKTHRVVPTIPGLLTWSYFGTLYRITYWPEAQFERQQDEQWIPTTPNEALLAAAAQQLQDPVWRAYLEFVPEAERTFLERFDHQRATALILLARDPELWPVLAETPALVAFLAAHESLRGTVQPCWNELCAVHERGGVWGLLEWLGLPASRQTLSILQHLADPEVPKRLLESVRSMLWVPSSILVLQRTAAITDRQLTRCHHALAA